MNFKIIATLMLLILVLVIIVNTNKEKYTTSTDSLISGNDSVDFFNINSIKDNTNLISLNRVGDVRTELKNGDWNLRLSSDGYITTTIIRERNETFDMKISSINPLYRNTKYDNVFVFLRSNGELQVIGIINSTKTINMLWYDISRKKTTTGTNKITVESNGNINSYFNGIKTSVLDVVATNNLTMALISQPEVVKLKDLNKRAINTLGTESSFTKRTDISRDNICYLKFDSTGNLVFTNSINSVTIIPNTTSTKSGKFFLVVTDDYMATYINDKNQIGKIELKNKNIFWRDPNSGTNSTEKVSLDFILSRPYTLFIDKQPNQPYKLILTGISRAGQRIAVTIASL